MSHVVPMDLDVERMREDQPFQWFMHVLAHGVYHRPVSMPVPVPVASLPLPVPLCSSSPSSPSLAHVSSLARFSKGTDIDADADADALDSGFPWLCHAFVPGCERVAEARH